jgi:hypothetical protein
MAEKGAAMPDTTNLRPLWLAWLLLTATLIGVAAGVLSWLAGMTAPAAVLSGGGAFAGATLLLINLQHFMTSRS